MTTPSERSRSIHDTRFFLRALTFPHATPRVPREIRQWACDCLHHFPYDSDMWRTAQKVPELWQEEK